MTHIADDVRKEDLKFNSHKIEKRNFPIPDSYLDLNTQDHWILSIDHLVEIHLSPAESIHQIYTVCDLSPVQCVDYGVGVSRHPTLVVSMLAPHL